MVQLLKIILEIQNALPRGAWLIFNGTVFSMREPDRVAQQCETFIQDFFLIAQRTNQVSRVNYNL